MSTVKKAKETTLERLPLVELEGEHPVAYVQLRLDQSQRENLSKLRKGLHDRHEKLANGNHVDSVADTLRWLMERLPELGAMKEGI